MIKRTFLLAGMALALAACGGGGGSEQDVSFENWVEAEVFYTYPYEGQRDVAPSAPVVVRFSEPVEVGPGNFTLEGPDGAVPVAVDTVDGGLSAVLTPEAALRVKSDYTLTLNDIRTENGEPSLPGGALNFTTRPALKGPLNLRESSIGFAVERVLPADDVPFLDFSSVNLMLSHPVDPDTLRYGETISLMQNGELVPATLLVDGRHITLDPRDGEDGQGEPVDAVTPGATLTLTLTNAVLDQQGEALPAFTKEFMPRDTRPRSTLVQEAAPTDPQLGCQDDGVRTSPITGDPINCVPLVAKLLGDNTVSKQQGNVFAELAFAPNFPDKTPLRVPRGSLLQGDPLDVNIGGAVPAGFDSGDVTVTFLSDANGYLLPNPYSDDPGAPKLLRLTMDVAFDTKTQKANGAFNQNLLQVELVGYGFTDLEKGSLVVEAVGVVEPEVLGVENAYGVLSFHMESYRDQESAPLPPEDSTGPQLAAWMPGEHTNKQRPGDPVILTFSEPVDPESIDQGTSLIFTAGGVDEPFDYYMDGVSVVIKPRQGLAHNTDYQVAFTNGITDIAGNPAQGETLTFSLPDYDTGAPQQAPVVLTNYPGFPCITVERDLANGDAGRCDGGKGDDDHLPLTQMPANREITVTFSQAMDPNTVNGDTFQVERVNATGNSLGPVEGEVDVSGKVLTFTPNQPWQAGSYYRYTLRSVTSSEVCGSNAMCDLRGLPLQTKLLAQDPEDAPAADQGGPAMPVYFEGAAASESVLQHLRNLPTSDVNANFAHESSEAVPSGTNSARKNSARIIPNEEKGPGSGAVDDANVGCEVGEDCPDAKYSYLTANLDVELVGYKTAAEAQAMDDGAIPQEVLDSGGVLVYILPTRIMVSNSTVYAEPAIGSADPAPTGPQLMRIRYTCDPTDPDRPCDETDQGRVKGWIVEEGDTPQFVTNLQLYLDAPKLSPVLNLVTSFTLTHNLHSYPLDLQLKGAVTFLEDGRLQIEQISQNQLDLDVELGGVPLGLAAGIHVSIPPGDTFLNYVSSPINN